MMPFAAQQEWPVGLGRELLCVVCCAALDRNGRLQHVQRHSHLRDRHEHHGLRLSLIIPGRFR